MEGGQGVTWLANLHFHRHPLRTCGSMLSQPHKTSKSGDNAPRAAQRSLLYDWRSPRPFSSKY
jgi:hypothetical protein